MKTRIAGLMCAALIAAQAYGQERKGELDALPVWVIAKVHETVPLTYSDDTKRFAQYFGLPAAETKIYTFGYKESDGAHAIYMVQHSLSNSQLFLIFKPTGKFANYYQTSNDGVLVSAACDDGDFKAIPLDNKAKDEFEREKAYWLKPIQQSRK